MYRHAHEKKITGLPHIYILTLSLRNLTSCTQACIGEYAEHREKRERVSTVSI